MRKFLTILIFVFVFFSFALPKVFSQDRFASCDLCGYCPPNNPPSNWEDCRNCIYKYANPDHTIKDTLKIDPELNQPPTPIPGRQFNMLGCIKTDLGSFRKEGAAASVTQIVLNFIFSLAGTIAFLFLIYGSFLYLTSQAEPERLNHAKQVIYGSIIGVVFTLLSVFIINLLASGVLKIPGFQGNP